MSNSIEDILQRQQPDLHRIYECAAQLHARVNQTYDGDLPYAFHLRLTASYVFRFFRLIDIEEDEVQTIAAAAYFHDSLEDTRITYNDLKKIFSELNSQGCHIQVEDAAEAVYALTNDKGRTREERAGEAYYAGIRATKYAPFLKMCDRLANIRFSTLISYPIDRMAVVYRKEMPHFLQGIGDVPQEMVDLAYEMLNGEK